MKCPECGLINPETAQRCDCGYDFEEKRPLAPYLTASAPKMIPPGQASGFWVRAWQGEERLWKVWWLVGVPFVLIANFLSIATQRFVGDSLLLTVESIVFVVVNVVLLSVAWRCAPNVDNKMWTLIARIVIVLGLVRMASDFLKPFQR